MTTLHGYILRDLLKTFALVQLGLSAMFTVIAGGVLWIRAEGVSSGDVLAFLPLVLPIVVTFTMPVGAIFATTMVYGRLAADNEWLACRAAGVNVHRLMLSAVLLGVFVMLFTLVAGNFIIPGFFRQINWTLRSNVRDFAFQQLRNKGHIRQQQKFFFTAEGVFGVPAEQLAQQGFPTGSAYSYILVTGPTCIQLDDEGKLERFTVAKRGLCQFDSSGQDVRVSLWVDEGRDFGPTTAAYVRSQKVGTITMPVVLPNKPAWQDPQTLERWRREPWHGDQVAKELRAFMQDLRLRRLYDDCRRKLAAGVMVLSDGQRSIQIQARELHATKDGRPLLTDPRVKVSESNGEVREYEAPRMYINGHPTLDDSLLIELQLAAVAGEHVVEIMMVDGRRVARHIPPPNLDVLGVPEPLRAELAAITPEAIFDESSGLTLEGELADKRLGLLASADAFRRKIDGQIHFRLGATVSAVVTVLMGAVLGVVFRGARALAAFALACVPFFAVLILTLMGRQLMENEGTEFAGKAVIWGGLGAMALADLVLLRLGVHR